MGSFHFEGDNLPLENRIYRIHIDMCSDEDQALNHFSGHCANSKEILFIANNTDTLSFPFTENNEMFCKVVAPNEKSEIFLKIDSLKNDMKYAFAAYRSEVNKKLNTQKWFKSLLDYGKSLDEPLAELYVYAYVSDRSNDFHQHYLEDLKKNNYYDLLGSQLAERYPNSPYTKQYLSELAADKYLVEKPQTPWWLYLLGVFAAFSVLANFYLIGKWRQLQRKDKTTTVLSVQEKKVMQLIMENKTNKEIASELFISINTVKTHINNLYKKLNVTSREELKEL